jgi:hypothetical protein
MNSYLRPTLGIQRVLLAIGVLTTASFAALAAESDGLTLSLNKTLVPGEVRIDFSGKPPAYVLYRSTDPVSLPGKASEIATTVNTTYVDTPPPVDDLVYYAAASRPAVLLELLPAAQDIAGNMETYRVLQDQTPYADIILNPAEFLFLASRCILALTSPDPYPPRDPPAGLVPPGDPYPEIDLEATFFDRSSSKDEYLALFRQIDEEYQSAGTYPPSVVVTGTTAEVRFSQMVHWAAGLLRAWQIQGSLPEIWNRYVISPVDLVPWNVPVGFEQYTSALESEGLPFHPTNSRRYYNSASHHYELLNLAREIYGNSNNAYQAGEKIYDWVMDRWQFVVGYSSGRTQFFQDMNAWGRANHFVHTSGVPKVVTSSLMRAAGIPASRSGAAYFPTRGWVNIDVHRTYGSDPLDNPFYYDVIPPSPSNHPYPTQFDDFVLRINDIVAEPGVSPSAGEVRSVYVNPRDVLDYGSAWVIDHLGDDFDAVVLTVKSMKGFVYFAGSGWPEREQQDALGPLIAEAHARGKKVYAALNTLGDIETGRGTPEWRQLLNETESGGQTYPNINVSPCVSEYRSTLESLLTNLVTDYDVDGVVLETLYFANVFGVTDTTGHPDCPTGADWMRFTISDYVAGLTAVVRGVDPDVSVVLSSFPQGRSNVFSSLAAEAEWGHQDMALLAPLVDDVLLSFGGTSWTHSDPPGWLPLIDEYRVLTGEEPWVSFNVVDEWEYTARFYRGVANLARGPGIAGFNLHTGLSTLGELSPALTRSQWQKVLRIRFAR